MPPFSSCVSLELLTLTLPNISEAHLPRLQNENDGGDPDVDTFPVQWITETNLFGKQPLSVYCVQTPWDLCSLSSGSWLHPLPAHINVCIRRVNAVLTSMDTLSFLMKSKEEAFLTTFPGIRRGGPWKETTSAIVGMEPTSSPGPQGLGLSTQFPLGRVNLSPSRAVIPRVQHWVGLHKYLLSDFMNPWPRKIKKPFIFSFLLHEIIASH